MNKLKGLFKITNLLLAKKYTNLNDIANSYTRVSEIYNESFLQEMHKYNKEMLDEVVKKYSKYKTKSNLKVIDLGCGTGFNSNFINSKITNVNFTLVDISDGMLKQAKNNCAIDGEFIKSDMLSFLRKSKDNSFDVVICAWAIKYQNPKKIIKEVSRVLKKDGYFAVIVNLKGTLPEVRKIYPELVLNNYKKIHKVMRELPNPISKNTFTRWFVKENFSKEKVKSGSHIFNFSNSNSLVSFVTSTGALAGFDAMVNMQDDEIKEYMIKIFDKRQINTITHKYVWGIFKNDK